MRTLIAFTLACLPLVAVAQPQSVDDRGLRITATTVAHQPAIKVADPNQPTGAVRTVTPFELAPDLSTRLVWLQVRNDGATDVEVPYRRLRLIGGPGADGPGPMSLTDLKKPWGRYLSWATNPPGGNTLWFEREQAVRAESYLDDHLFPGGTIPPGGQKTGYVAFSRQDGSLNATGLQLEIQQGPQIRTVTVPLTTEPAH